MVMGVCDDVRLDVAAKATTVVFDELCGKALGDVKGVFVVGKSLRNKPQFMLDAKTFCVDNEVLICRFLRYN